jgi:hypothetical protein
MLICTALASSPLMTTLGVGGIPGLSGVAGKQRLSYLSFAVAAAAAASLRLLYSQSSACRASALAVMTPVGPRILSLKYV